MIESWDIHTGQNFEHAVSRPGTKSGAFDIEVMHIHFQEIEVEPRSGAAACYNDTRLLEHVYWNFASARDTWQLVTPQALRSDPPSAGDIWNTDWLLLLLRKRDAACVLYLVLFAIVHYVGSERGSFSLFFCAFIPVWNSELREMYVNKRWNDPLKKTK